MDETIKKVTNILSSDALSMMKLLPFKNRNSGSGDLTIQRSSQFYSDANQTISLNISGSVGRPMNKAMIVMAGQIGSGKSTIINNLFKYERLCETDSRRGAAVTTEIIEYGKLLKIGRHNQTHTLSFVDVPGIISDDNADNANQDEEKNLALIKHFRKTHSDLKGTEAEKTRIYPNLILLTVNPVANRQLVGKNSNFQKTLRCLLNCDLVDLLKPNLVVVVTHAYSIKTDETRKVKQNIQAALLDEIKISAGIPIVFVENKPGKGTYCSHFNLIEAMVNTCTENDDDLGKLSISSYFGSNGPENKQDVQFMSRFTSDSLSKTEIDESVTALQDLGIRIGKKSIAQEMSSFNRLGYGYCPKNESTKDNVFRKNDRSKEQHIGKLPRRLPSNLIFLPKNEIRSDRLSCEQKRSYEDNMVVSYGLDADVKLVVSASSNGRWTKGKSNSAESTTMSFIFETRLGKLRIEDPLEDHISETLSNILKNLPEVYREETATKFNQFFSKWGTHFITEQYIGGSIKVNCTLNTSSSSENAQRKIAGQLDNIFKQLATVSPSTDLTMTGKASNWKEMSRHSLVISGGCAQSVPTVADLTPEMFKTWIESVSEDPVELEHSTKLYPYYNLIDSESLREATLAYLDGSLHNFIEGLKLNRNVYGSQEPQGIKGLASEIIMKQLKRFST